MKRLFVSGDSTTGLNPPSPKTGDKVSWSDSIGSLVLDSQVEFRNRSCPGRTIRDYHHRGLLDALLLEALEGDIVLACHGHLEKTPLTRPNDRARGSLPGDGDLSVEVYDSFFDRMETVHTFGWYIRQYAELCRARKLIPVFLSPPVRNVWENGRIRRTRSAAYADTMKEVCNSIAAIYVDIAANTENFLNGIGEESASRLYLPDDITHTNAAGAATYAVLIAEHLASHESMLFDGVFALPSRSVSV